MGKEESAIASTGMDCFKRQSFGAIMIGLDLLQQCAPQVAPVTMAAIVQTESGGNPLVMLDNTTGKRYYPTNRQEAERILQILMAQGHKVDVGLGQVDTENFARYGLTYQTAFNACTNLRAAARILVASWKLSGHQLFHALQVYNSGKSHGDASYARRVYRQADVVVPAIPNGKMAPWVTRPIINLSSGATKPLRERENQPVRLQVSWDPAASPLKPTGNMTPSW